MFSIRIRIYHAQILFLLIHFIRLANSSSAPPPPLIWRTPDITTDTEARNILNCLSIYGIANETTVAVSKTASLVIISDHQHFTNTKEKLTRCWRRFSSGLSLALENAEGFPDDLIRIATLGEIVYGRVQLQSLRRNERIYPTTGTIKMPFDNKDR
ncbi:hypothetical protein BZL39_A02390 [Zygosaccharomyces parabailii]|nr:hypothetical protein BZL39_A02390 [Zygosaccharomyces parabailii]CDH12981.1 uncharacterized protein ZBAI_04767 [Zygosaccharomyces bailii ISA1307]